jgi:hypothetical protein
MHGQARQRSTLHECRQRRFGGGDRLAGVHVSAASEASSVEVPIARRLATSAGRTEMRLVMIITLGTDRVAGRRGGNLHGSLRKADRVAAANRLEAAGVARW